MALIAGPTASGKSQLAVDLAQRLARDGRRGVVVNADSQQVYRELHILSARPSEGETQGIGTMGLDTVGELLAGARGDFFSELRLHHIAGTLF